MLIEDDFLCDTILHVSEVQENLEQISSDLRKRGFAHDRTKFQAFEFDSFVYNREKFKKANYGTPEYQECVELVKPAVEHHHHNNSHHTEFYDNGINGMNLMDLCEMIADWKAAARRSPDLDLVDTLDYAYKKYGIGTQLGEIIANTLVRLGWIEKEARHNNKDESSHSVQHQQVSIGKAD